MTAFGGQAKLVGISVDCPDPQRLADFYLGLLGGRQMWAKESSVGIEVPGAVLIAQQVEGYVPPDWPGTAIVHLDLTADDLDAAEERAVALGARLPEQPDPRWRVLLDPAGHPFCLTPFTPNGGLTDQPGRLPTTEAAIGRHAAT